MASAVDICNLALSHLGDSATVSSISPPEGSVQAEACARFYPIARDALLETHAWNFAVQRATLAEVADAAPGGWGFAYVLPANCLRVLGVFSNGGGKDESTEDFIIEASSTQPLIYTNAETAAARYIVRITDTTRFSPLFVQALSLLLAYYLAGVVLKGETGIKIGDALHKRFLFEMGRAAMANANSRRFMPDRTPGSISARA